MFIRRTLNRRTANGTAYHTHRLVCSERLGKSVRQRTLLSLGRHFTIPSEQWALLCSRISEVVAGQSTLRADCSPEVEQEAQRIAAQLVARGSRVKGVLPEERDIQAVDVNSMQLVRPRSVGVEHAGLWALEEVGLPGLLTGLGVGGKLCKAATALIVGRMAFPASERATYRWLRTRSGLGELIGLDFEAVSPMLLYRASDMLVRASRGDRGACVRSGDEPFRPTADDYPLRSDEHLLRGRCGAAAPCGGAGIRRTSARDCPLLTLGLMLDASGFVRRSQLFAGNVREHRTLEGMLEALGAPAGALVVMDRGVATEGCIGWLRDKRVPVPGGEPRAPSPLRSRYRRGDPDEIESDAAPAQGGHERSA